MICEIKGRKKHCYEEGYNAVAQVITLRIKNKQ